MPAIKQKSSRETIPRGSIRKRKRKIECKETFQKEIGNIIGQGIQISKSKIIRLKNINEAEKLLEKKFFQLKENSETIMRGYEKYRFDEEVTQNYKKDLQAMWMRA